MACQKFGINVTLGYGWKNGPEMHSSGYCFYNWIKSRSPVAMSSTYPLYFVFVANRVRFYVVLWIPILLPSQQRYEKNPESVNHLFICQLHIHFNF